MIQDPFAACSRCTRCNLTCRIDANFKRVGKRKRNAEMESEIQWLRQELANRRSQATDGSTSQAQQPGQEPTTSASFVSGTRQIAASPLDQYMGSHDAVNSLLDLKTGGDFLKSPNPRAKPAQRLEDIVLTPEQINELFDMLVKRLIPSAEC